MAGRHGLQHYLRFVSGVTKVYIASVTLLSAAVGGLLK
jgi:hypothetical protein